MEFLPSIERWQPDGVASAVTIGMFDGLHLGHQGLLRMLRENALARGLRTAVLTFDHHPRTALLGQPPKDALTTLPEKLGLLDQLGIDLCAVIPVAGSVLSLQATDFIQQFLVERLAARLLVVGYDFRFGKNRSGDLGLLQSLSGTSGYTVMEARPVLVQNKPVKSTWIRSCIREGNMPEAAELLGRAYSVEGCVVQGDQLGRQIGFPTANVQYAADKLLPASGVYAGLLRVEGSAWPAAINLGLRPTIKPEGTGATMLLEAHLPGFSGDLYGKSVKIEFKERLREERRFGSVEALKQQILLDVQQVIASQPRKLFV